MVLWYCGTVIFWYCGTVTLWYSGTVVLWYCGLVVWYYGTVVCRSRGNCDNCWPPGVCHRDEVNFISVWPGGE